MSVFTKTPLGSNKINVLAKPERFGPGVWFTIHLYARHATTEEKKKAFIDYMNLIVANLKCKDCRHHATQYVMTHPIEDYFNVKDNNNQDIGLFKWTWTFHNAVNSRLKKPLMDWDTAYNMYSDPNVGVCTSACGDDPSPASQKETKGLRLAPKNKR
jgi:hypothetical protein